MKPVSKSSNKSKIGLILLAFLAFIALGLPDGLLGVAWPTIRSNFSIPLDAIGMLLVAGTLGYVTSSFLSGTLLSRMGVGGLLAASCGLTGAGLIGYTLVPSWWMMVLLGVIAGLGAGAIDSGLNTYVAANFSEKLMQWLHASYGIGVTLGPIIMTTTLNTFSSWRLGYNIVGIWQLLLGASFILTLPLWAGGEKHKSAAGENKRLTDYKTPLSETLSRPEVWLSLALFFFYTGAESSLGTWTYSLLTGSRGIQPSVAGLWAGSYWATFTIGRILAGLYTKRISLLTLLGVSMAAAVAGMGLLWWNPINGAGLVGIALTGFAIAPIFPGLVSGTSQRVGRKYAANTIGMQMGAASLGVAVIPGTIGVLARYISLEVIPVVLFILFAVLCGLFFLSTQMQKSVEIQSLEETKEANPVS
jgi:fucose permease